MSNGEKERGIRDAAVHTEPPPDVGLCVGS